MEQLEIREKVIEELRMIPDEQMGNIYEFLRHIRTEPQNSITNVDKIMGFAGCWTDMPENAFTEFIQEMRDRRTHEFRGHNTYKRHRPSDKLNCALRLPQDCNKFEVRN